MNNNSSKRKAEDGDSAEASKKTLVEQKNWMVELPDELSQQIIVELDAESLIRCGCVCRKWYVLFSNAWIWRDKFEKPVDDWDFMPSVPVRRVAGEHEDPLEHEVFPKFQYLQQKYLVRGWANFSTPNSFQVRLPSAANPGQREAFRESQSLTRYGDLVAHGLNMTLSVVSVNEKQVLWNFTNKTTSVVSLRFVRSGACLLALFTHQLIMFDARTGEQQWSYADAEPSNLQHRNVLWEGDSLFFARANSHLELFDFRREPDFLVWEHTARVHVTSLALGPNLLMFTGNAGGEVVQCNARGEQKTRTLGRNRVECLRLEPVFGFLVCCLAGADEFLLLDSDSLSTLRTIEGWDPLRPVELYNGYLCNADTGSAVTGTVMRVWNLVDQHVSTPKKVCQAQDRELHYILYSRPVADDLVVSVTDNCTLSVWFLDERLMQWFPKHRRARGTNQRTCRKLTALPLNPGPAFWCDSSALCLVSGDQLHCLDLADLAFYERMCRIYDASQWYT